MVRAVDLKTGLISTVYGIAGSRAMAVDCKGNVFTPADNILIADAGNHLIRRFVVSERKLETIAGVGTRGMNGVPGPALQAELGEPHGVVTHPRTGDIYIDDLRNHRVLRLKAVTSPVREQSLPPAAAQSDEKK